MIAFKCLKKGVYLLSALFLLACQPSPSDKQAIASDDVSGDSAPIITDSSVTMAPEHILSIKSSRYQPSLGLQGKIEPIKKINLMTLQPLAVTEVLVKEGQWVEKGAPLLIVKRLNDADQTSASLTAQAEDLPNASETDVQSLNATTGKAPEKAPKDTENDVTASDPQKAKSDDGNDDNSNNGSNNDKSADNSSATTVTQSTEDTIQTSKSAKNAEMPPDLITIRASFSGRVENLQASTGSTLKADAQILQLSDKNTLHFTATLPIQAKPQLSVGQTVNFTINDSLDKFTGQVSKLKTTSQPTTLLVYVNVIENETTREKLLPNMAVKGRVNHGQIEVGTIVPKQALHNVDLSELQTPPHKPLRPLAANVWVIGQDQRLIHQPIEVIEYDPSTDQYLIAGISNDSLICLANLPIDSKGKKVIVS